MIRFNSIPVDGASSLCGRPRRRQTVDIDHRRQQVLPVRKSCLRLAQSLLFAFSTGTGTTAVFYFHTERT
jgi:hypothetical protein